MNKSDKKFSWSAFISFGLFFSFIIISFSGIILYIAPSGRVTSWVNWQLVGFNKDEWQAIHIVFSFIFVFLAIFHLLSINWKVFISYIKAKAEDGFNKKKELILSSALTVLFFLGIIYSVPPISSTISFGSYLKQSWVNIEKKPPLPYAELLTLHELSERLNIIPIEILEHRLKDANIKFNNFNETLEKIGLLNNLPPSDIYNIITQKYPESR